MMNGGSLRLRLFAGTLAWMLLSIALAGWGLRTLFQQHIMQTLEAQLVLQLDHLSAAVDWGSDARVQVAAMVADPRWSQPLSGLYWQIDRLGAQPQAALERSRSLWDQTLQLPAAPTTYPRQGHSVLSLRDAQGHALLAVARTLQLPDEGAPPLRLVVAGDQALLAEPLQRFTRLLLIALGMLASGLALAVAVQLHLALRPLKLLRQRLGAVRSGAAAQLAGSFPQELQPLVAEFNHVLGENAAMVQHARTQAGNLAHAVHTPLSILANAAARDDGALAQLVGEQVAAARRQVDWHLARARAAAAVRATGMATPVLEPLQALLRTMARLHGGHEKTPGPAPAFSHPLAGPGEARAGGSNMLSFELGPHAQRLTLEPAALTAPAFRGEAQDLYELLGNLIDNAGKWARQRVVVDVQREGAELCFTIDDDGPGIPLEQRARMFERGVQLDEQRPGTGLGLDIVRTLAQTYGGSVQALDSPLGGARLRLCLPAADAG